MAKDVRIKVIEVPFHANDGSVILEQKLNGFFQEEKLSLRDVQITHAVQYRNNFPTQIYTVFYEKK